MERDSPPTAEPATGTSRYCPPASPSPASALAASLAPVSLAPISPPPVSVAVSPVLMGRSGLASGGGQWQQPQPPMVHLPLVQA